MNTARKQPVAPKTHPGPGGLVSEPRVAIGALPLLHAMLTVVAVLLTAACASFSPSDTAPTDPASYSGTPDSYVAVAPATLRSGQTTAVSVSLFDGAAPARGMVSLALSDPAGGRTLAETTQFVAGNAPIQLDVPELEEGDYVLRLSGEGDDGAAYERVATVRVEPASPVLFLETDKPIYKPGQQLRFRALRLNQDLRPLPGTVTVEALDAKGIKVYRRTIDANQFGMADGALPLSSEPNLGVWTLVATAGEQTAQLDIRVEEYVLPKYEVSIDLPREWTLVGEAVVGTVTAEYSYGKPVQGEVEVVASRYVGAWEEYAKFSGEIDGEVSFEIPPVGYVAGSPAAGGQGNVRLDVTVREPATGYAEQTSRLLTVSASPVNLRLIPESSHFKPGLPFSLLLVSETPDKQPADAVASVNLTYYGDELEPIGEEDLEFEVVSGKALVRIESPEGAVAVEVHAQTSDAEVFLALSAGYSPSGNFIHVEQTNEASLEVGGQVTFRVHSTTEARTFYYEVAARGRVVFSGITHTPEITLDLTPEMAPSARLVVYQILPNNEVAADYLPFDVSANYPMQVAVDFGVEQAAPGATLEIDVKTDGPAMVGLAAVDRSVFILSENRLNLRQVFDELERLYAEPRAEVHLERLPHTVASPGTAETFRKAGLVTLGDKFVPEGASFSRPVPQPSLLDRSGVIFAIGLGVIIALGLVLAVLYGFVKLVRLLMTVLLMMMVASGVWVGCAGGEEPIPGAMGLVESEAMAPADAPAAAGDERLAEAPRVRQYFPETWLWTDVMTDETGSATLPATTPDSITTWQMRAVGMSLEHGLGVADTELVVFQPFFLQLDLPYSAIRGEEFPVRVSLYNYIDVPQEFLVELDESPRFTLLGDSVKTATVGPNEVGGVNFDVRLTELGSLPIKVTARSRESSDAIVKTLLVEPEGVEHEMVQNFIVSAGDRLQLDVATPPGAIPGSGRAYVNLTGNYVAQALDGLEDLLRMPYGCGEQNMILFAPNIYVARYLEATGQAKPDVMAKAEFLMTTGYQRELTYRRSDGSFSAFGQSDRQGSLWLTAFVLKSFAQADGLIYVDESVMADAREWIRSHQRSDGSFEPVGFLHHQELLGGLRGNTALTAYVAIALLEAGDFDAAGHALSYLESQLEGISDEYAMSIVAYALALGDSPKSAAAHERLLEMAVAEDGGLRWGNAAPVEATAYAALALLQRDDALNAEYATRWLVGQRNAQGGFGSTQDTVVGLQALIESASRARFDVDATVGLTSGEWTRHIAIDESNVDVVQIVELPAGASLLLDAAGLGEVVAQLVHRYNMPAVERRETERFQIEVDYSADRVTVDDLIDITAHLSFLPPENEEVEAGMIVLDVATPTGFAPVRETVEALVEDVPQVKRYEIAGRKVILYVEDLEIGEWLEFRFQARAQYPVRAQPVASQVYSYYQPHWRGETLGASVIVEDR